MVRLALIALALGVAAAPPDARALVLEIGDNGAVRRFDGPACITYDGKVHSLRTTARPQRVSRPLAAASPNQMRVVKASLQASAKRHAIHQDLLEALAKRESNFNPQAVSNRGALGVMQLMPATARALHVDPADPAANIDGGTAYLGGLLARYDGDIVKALAAYNAGPAAVDRNHGTPPYRETRAYVGAVLEMMAERVAPRTTRSPRP